MKYNPYFVSDKLDREITYYDIPNLTDFQLTTLYYELKNDILQIKIVISSHEDTDMSPEVEFSIRKANKKLIVVKEFCKECRYEMQQRFMRINSLNQENIQELHDEFCAIVESNSYRKSNKSFRKFYDCFFSLLEETYGDRVVLELQENAEKRILLKSIS